MTTSQGEDLSGRSASSDGLRNALVHLGVLLAMVGGGLFSLFLAGHLSYWTPLWLPAGVALVAALSLGNRASIVIGIGSFISYWFMFDFEADPGLRILSSLIGALASVTGILAATGLIRYWIKWPNPLDSFPQLSQFFLAAILVEPLITGTISATGWFLIGVVSKTSISFTWLTHTLAHAVGTSMLVPILLLWVERPKAGWLNRKGVVAGTMIVAAAAGLCLLAYASRMAMMEIRSQFDDEANQLTAAMERELVSRTEAIESVRALWESSEEVTREEFREFTRRSLQRFADVEFIGWAPQIAEPELDYLNSSAQEEAVSEPDHPALLNSFEVHSPPVLAQPVGTGAESENALSVGQAIPFPFRYPVFYLEPLTPNATWLGADLSSYAPFLKTALRTGEAKVPLISPPFRESKSGTTCVLLCLGARESAAYQLQKRIAQKPGLAIAVLSFDGLFDESIQSLGRKPGVSVRISALEDESNPDSMVPFFQTGATAPSAAPPDVLRDLNRDVFIGGQRWFIEFFPVPASFGRFLRWNITGVQVGVTMVTSLLAAMLLLVSRFTFRIESEVSDRTRERDLSELRFRQLAENVSEIFWVINSADSTIDYLSPAYESISGKPSAELEGKVERWIERVHSADRSRYRAALQQSYSGQEFDEEYRIERPDGEIRWIRDRAFPLFDESGRIIRIIGVANDMTARKQSEEDLIAAQKAIEEVNRTLNQYFRVSLDMLCIAGTDGYFKQVNPAFTGNLGFDEEVLLGKPFLEMIHPDDLPKTLEAVAGLKEGRTVVSFENRYLHSDDYYIWVEWNAVPDEKGELIYAAGRNVTERKQMENELRRSNAELEQFAYVASHDLREPLRMVTSFVQLLKRRYGGALGADADEYIGHAVEGTERMRRMIEGLLQMSRVERLGRGLEVVNSAVPLEESLDSLAITIKESGTVVRRPDRMPSVRGDAAQMVQIFQNLIANAIKSVERGRHPEITIETRRDGNFMEFSIRDNGCGIARENHEKIFHIFHRLDRTDNEGCGIGLSLCRRIVERHGGRLTVKSEPGEGSVFLFTLPAA
jgi:PAS domain S-box-containing protein